MNEAVQKPDVCVPAFFEISDDDVMEAMKEIQGYIDITLGDFKNLYQIAYRHAIERMTRAVRARDVMTRDVISVNMSSSSGEVAHLMAAHGIAGLPVLDDYEKVVGIISEKDFLSGMGGQDARSFMDVIAQCLENKGCVAITMRQQKAGDLMTSPVVTVREDTPVSEITDTFTSKNINRVPVVDNAGRLIGIVARADIIQSSFTVGVNK